MMSIGWIEKQKAAAEALRDKSTKERDMKITMDGNYQTRGAKSYSVFRDTRDCACGQ